MHLLLRRLALSGSLGLMTVLASCRDPGGGSASVTPVAELQPQRVTVEAFASARNGSNALVLDVRTPGEFAAGHVPGAVILDVSSDGFEVAIRQLQTDRPILVYCRSGRRSARACSILREAGFTNVLDLAAGLQGWQAADQPVER